MTTKPPERQLTDRLAVLSAINRGRKTLEAIIRETGLGKEEACDHAIALVQESLVRGYQVRGAWWLRRSSARHRRGAFGRGAGGIHGLPESWFSGQFEPDWEKGFFAIRLMRKDVGLATQLAREYDVPMPLANLAEQELIEAINRGWGDDPTNKVRLLQEDRAAVQLRGEIPTGHTRLEIEE